MPGFGLRRLVSRIRRRLYSEFWARWISVLPVAPLSPMGGFERGRPIDRVYIEGFLARHADDIRGHALEVGDDTYCRRFGQDKVTRQDILSDSAVNPATTIVGDISRPETLPNSVFDCIVLTQVLQYVFDLPSAVRSIHSALKPGGVALITVPAVSHLVADEWRSQWCWLFTQTSVTRLFEDVFGNADLEVNSYGNCLTATAFHYGLAVKDISVRALEQHDPSYPICLTVAVRKGLYDGG